MQLTSGACDERERERVSERESLMKSNVDHCTSRRIRFTTTMMILLTNIINCAIFKLANFKNCNKRINMDFCWVLIFNEELNAGNANEILECLCM